MMLSGCYHGASANIGKDSERLLYGTFFCKSTLRQEENQYLANDLEIIRDYPDRILRIMAFDISKPFLGWAEMGHPKDSIRKTSGQKAIQGESELLYLSLRLHKMSLYRPPVQKYCLQWFL